RSYRMRGRRAILAFLSRALRFPAFFIRPEDGDCLLLATLPVDFGEPGTVCGPQCILIPRGHYDALPMPHEAQHACLALQNVSNEHTLACNEEFSCSRAGSRLPTAGGTPDRPGWWRAP